jgi:hypothetical protein
MNAHLKNYNQTYVKLANHLLKRPTTIKLKCISDITPEMEKEIQDLISEIEK